jgi:hypothetical protein
MVGYMYECYCVHVVEVPFTGNIIDLLCYRNNYKAHLFTE